MKRFPWLLLFALAAGVGLGILYSWIIAPVQYVDTTPASLRADFKDQMRSVIAASYAATGNLERARARLKQLGDMDPVQALSAQAQRMIAQGDSLGTVEEVAQLAEVLQSGAPVQPSTPSPLAQSAATRASSPAASLPVGLTETIIPEQVINPPATVSTPTPRPTRTPTPAPGRPYELVAQDTLCDSELQEGLLQVIVMDGRRREVPGAQIIASWDGGEEHFFTGFKPELGDGYADFIMQAGVQYSLRVADGGPPISGVIAPSCTADDGTITTGQIKLTFQRQ